MNPGKRKASTQIDIIHEYINLRCKQDGRMQHQAGGYETLCDKKTHENQKRQGWGRQGDLIKITIDILP